MREKRRYVLVEQAEPVVKADQERFAEQLNGELMRVIGEIDFPLVNPKIMKFVDEKLFIVRTSLEGQGKMVLALSLIKSVGGKETAFYTLKSSGTIRTLDDFTKSV